MKLAVLSTASVQAPDTAHLRGLANFRKATRSMALACAGIEAATQPTTLGEWLKLHPERFGLVLGSAFGELETTKDFLKSYADNAMARPLLFQNSLHNSTCGFVSIHYKITGPAVTISHGLFAAEQCLETASLLLTQNLCDFCLVSTVETFVPELLAQSTGGSPVENATVYVVASEAAAQSHKLTPLAFIEDVECFRPVNAKSPSYSGSLISSSGTLPLLARQFEVSGANLPQSKIFRVQKTDVAYSLIHWSQT